MDDMTSMCAVSIGWLLEGRAISCNRGFSPSGCKHFHQVSFCCCLRWTSGSGEKSQCVETHGKMFGFQLAFIHLISLIDLATVGPSLECNDCGQLC